MCYSGIDNMIAVILMAGSGIRLMPLTKNVPKGLLIIRDQTLLERLLNSCKLAGIDKCVVVTGYNHERVVENAPIIGDICDVEIDFVYNEDYNLTGTAYSAYLGCKDLDDDVLLISGNLILQDELISKMVSSDKSSILDDYGEFVGVTKIKKEDLDDFNYLLKYNYEQDKLSDYDLVYSLLSECTSLEFVETEDFKWIAIKTHPDWDKAQLLVDDLIRI